MAENPLTQEMLDQRSYGAGSRARFDPAWAMSRPQEWYLKKENLRSIKPTLVRHQAQTTDPNESRNMYQMLMNQIKGGGGAPLTGIQSLIPGKTFTPSTIGGDFGQAGRDFYKKEFPIASGLTSLMGAAENLVPGIGWLKRMLPKRKKKVLPRLAFDPDPNEFFSPPWELLEDKVEEEPDIVTNLVDGDSENDLTENFLANEKEEIPFEFNLGELMKDLTSIKVNPDMAAQYGFEGSATELWTRAKEESKQSGQDFSGEEVLERLFKEGWFDPDESIAVGDM